MHLAVAEAGLDGVEEKVVDRAEVLDVAQGHVMRERGDDGVLVDEVVERRGGAHGQAERRAHVVEARMRLHAVLEHEKPPRGREHRRDAAHRVELLVGRCEVNEHAVGEREVDGLHGQLPGGADVRRAVAV